MTDKPNAYPTAEHFARARADIARRRADLDTELTQLDWCEQFGVGIAERYPEALVEEEAKGTSPPPTTRRKTKRPNAGRPYKPNENVRIVNAERGELKALAEALGRDYPGVLKQHEVLLKQQRAPENTDTPAPAPALEVNSNRPGVESNREKEVAPIELGEEHAPPEKPIVEATAVPRTAQSTDPRHVPARVVDTIIDNGPGRPPRVYGVGFASSRSD